MGLATIIKQFFLNAFRELFIYHHNSLEFRAKLFATIIIADEKDNEVCYYDKVDSISKNIYKDSMRQETLLLTTMEYVKKAKDDNGLGIDELIYDIIDELKTTPRYSKKIDVIQLSSIVGCSKDEDSLSYQNSIIQFFGNLKSEKESE